jgi:hypothetical protein
MGILDSFIALAAEVWRKYNTAGVPASGLHSPELQDIEQWGDDVESALETIFALLPVGAEPILVTGASATIAAKTTAIAVQRAAPSTTALALPAVADQQGIPLRISDWSTAVTDHTITLTPDGSETIMGNANYNIFSSATQNGGASLYPSTALGGWYLAP